MLMAIALAFRQVRSDNPVAVLPLLGWSAFMGGALTVAGLLRGLLPVDFWTQHVLQFPALLEIVL